MNVSPDFNFDGACEIDYQKINILMSINADEVVHRVKILIDPSLKNQNSEEALLYQAFITFAENKKIHDVDKFFTNENKKFNAFYYAFQRGYLSYLGELTLIQKRIKTGKILCNCTGMTEEEWTHYLQTKKLTIDNVIKETKIATGCGSCRADLNVLLKSYEEFPNKTSKEYLALWEDLDLKKTEYLCRCKKVSLREIADYFESYTRFKSKKLLIDLQTKWKIGLSCHDCIDCLKSYDK